MKAYSIAITSLRGGAPIFETLPRMTPRPGSTPDAPTISGSLDATTGDITVGWSEVTDASVTSLQLRATTGPEYDDEDATILAHLDGRLRRRHPGLGCELEALRHDRHGQ